jgi:hypothetical protein
MRCGGRPETSGRDNGAPVTGEWVCTCRSDQACWCCRLCCSCIASECSCGRCAAAVSTAERACCSGAGAIGLVGARDVILGTVNGRCRRAIGYGARVCFMACRGQRAGVRFGKERKRRSHTPPLRAPPRNRRERNAQARGTKTACLKAPTCPSRLGRDQYRLLPADPIHDTSWWPSLLPPCCSSLAPSWHRRRPPAWSRPNPLALCRRPRACSPSRHPCPVCRPQPATKSASKHRVPHVRIHPVPRLTLAR